MNAQETTMYWETDFYKRENNDLSPRYRYKYETNIQYTIPSFIEALGSAAIKEIIIIINDYSNDDGHGRCVVCSEIHYDNSKRFLRENRYHPSYNKDIHIEVLTETNGYDVIITVWPDNYNEFWIETNGEMFNPEALFSSCYKYVMKEKPSADYELIKMEDYSASPYDTQYKLLLCKKEEYTQRYLYYDEMKNMYYMKINIDSPNYHASLVPYEAEKREALAYLIEDVCINIGHNLDFLLEHMEDFELNEQAREQIKLCQKTAEKEYNDLLTKLHYYATNPESDVRVSKLESELEKLKAIEKKNKEYILILSIWSIGSLILLIGKTAGWI